MKANHAHFKSSALFFMGLVVAAGFLLSPAKVFADPFIKGAL